MLKKIKNSEIYNWSLPGVVDFYNKSRSKKKDLYLGEKFFLEKRLFEDMSILDVGCAQGGFISIIKNYIKNFSYTGIDISESMIKKAKRKNSKQKFYCTTQGNLNFLKNKKFDLVLVLGILHLNKNWRNVLISASKFYRKSIIFDLREIQEKTIEDKKKSFMSMTFNKKNFYEKNKLPYNLININDSHNFLKKIFKKRKILKVKYSSKKVTNSATVPTKKVIFSTYCVDR